MCMDVMIKRPDDLVIMIFFFNYMNNTQVEFMIKWLKSQDKGCNAQNICLFNSFLQSNIERNGN